MSILSTEGLQKRYKGTTVVKGVDINVETGEVVGLLGPNGAGKTTCTGASEQRQHLAG